MPTEIITTTTKDGEEIVFAVESDPNWVADTEYEDEDGSWISEDEEQN